MENLVIYLVENLLKFGDVEKCDFKLGCEDAFMISIEYANFALTRSEIMLLKSECENRLAYMLDDDCKIWNKLFSLL